MIFQSAAFSYAANNPPGDPPPCDDICSCESEDEDDEGGDGASIGSISYALGLGKSAFPLLKNGVLRIKKGKPTLDLYDPSVLFCAGTAAKKIWRDETTNGTRTFSFLGSTGQFNRYRFSEGAGYGIPIEQISTSRTRAYLLDAGGNVVANATGNNAVYVELRFANTARQRYSLETKQIVGVGNTEGQYLDISTIPQAARAEVIWHDNTLRQIKTPGLLADIVRLPDDGVGFSIKLYPLTQTGPKVDDVYSVSGDPYRTIIFTNPLPNNPNPRSLKITDLWGTQTKDYLFTYQENLDDWMLAKGNGALKESKELVSPPDANPKVYRRLLKDANGNIVSTVESSVLLAPWKGSLLQYRTVDPAGLNYRTEYTYNMSANTPGYGKMLSQANPDGSWSRYVYDSQGRLSKQISPWLDSPVSSAEAVARVTEYQYASHDSTDVVSENDSRPRTEIERINNIETRRTYYVYKTNANGEKEEIVERAVAQGSAYGATGNLRAIKTYYADNSSFASTGQIKSAQQPNGRLTSYSYTYDNATNKLLSIATEGAVSSPAGVAYKSLREITTRDARGLVVQEETQVYTGSGYSTLNIHQNVYDMAEHLIQRSKDGRVVYDAVYNANEKISETDEDGITKTYTYDELDRLATETKVGTENRANIVTTYNRTLGGLDCGCDANLEIVVSADGLSLTSSVKKDQLGRILEQTDQTGLVTTYAYTNGGRTVTILKPNTATEIRETFIDGQLKSTTGTGVIAQYTTYGINNDGTQWHKANLVAPDGPRWTKNTNDFLGRGILSESPGFAGAILSNTIAYNPLGQVSTQTKASTPGSADAPSATGTQTTSFTYDLLGNTIATSAQTIDATGQATSPITNLSEQYYTQENSAWFSISKEQLQYTENGQQQTIITSLSKQQFNNFTASVVEYVESYEAPFDGNGVSVNKTILSTTIDRSIKTSVATTTFPASIQSAIQTTINGLLISNVSPSHGGATLYQYDALGRPSGQKQPRHASYSTISYNDRGQIVATTDAAGNTTSYVYYDNGVIGAGQLRQEINALGDGTFHEYNLRGRETYTWGPATYPTIQGYDVYGQRNSLKTFRDIGVDFNTPFFPVGANGDTTTWVYDDATGLLLQKLYADNKGPSYAYYADGLLKTRTWARKDVNNNPLTTTYTYTPQGQLSFIDYSDLTPDVTYIYNTLGQQISVADGSGTRNYTYDPATQAVTQEIYSGIISGTLKRAYDAYNRPTGYALVEQSDPQSNPVVRTAVTYAYDTHDNFHQVQCDTIPSQLATRLSSANTSPLVLNTFTYNRATNSDLIATVVGPVHTVINTYEPNRDVVVTKQNRVTVGFEANSIASQYDYTVNALGQRVSRTQSGTAFDGNGYAPGTDLPRGMTGIVGSATSTDTFSYNSRGELINSINNIHDNLARSYSYDPIGNRLNITEREPSYRPTEPRTRSYVSNALNQYTQINQTPYSEFFAGPLIHDADGNLFTSEAGEIYTWDCENRLTQVTFPHGKIVKYHYDADSRRVKRENTIPADGQTMTTYLYDGWNVIHEHTTIATATEVTYDLTETRHWGLDLSNTPQGAGGTGGLLHCKAIKDYTIHHHYTYDANGNVSEILGPAGTTTAHYEYDPFGRGRIHHAIGLWAEDNNYSFSTKPWDYNTNLFYYGYRYYSIEHARWMSRDLINETDCSNLYSFLKNDDLSKTDALGLYAFIIRIRGGTKPESTFGPALEAENKRLLEYKKEYTTGSKSESGKYAKDSVTNFADNEAYNFDVDFEIKDRNKIAIELKKKISGLTKGFPKVLKDRKPKIHIAVHGVNVKNIQIGGMLHSREAFIKEIEKLSNEFTYEIVSCFARETEVVALFVKAPVFSDWCWTRGNDKEWRGFTGTRGRQEPAEVLVGDPQKMQEEANRGRR